MSSSLSSKCQYCKTQLASADSVERHQRFNKRCIKLRTEVDEQQQSSPSSPHYTHTSLESEASASISPINPDLPQQQALKEVFQIISTDKVQKLMALTEEVKELKNSCVDQKYVDETKNELLILINHAINHLTTVTSFVVRDGTFNPLRGKGGRTDAENKVIGAYFLMGMLKMKMASERHRRALQKMHKQFDNFFRVPIGTNTQQLEALHAQWRSILPSEEESKIGAMSWTVGSDVRLQTTEDWALAIEWLGWVCLKTKLIVKMHLKHPVPVADIIEHAEDLKTLTTLFRQKQAILTQAFGTSVPYGGGYVGGSGLASGYGYGGTTGSYGYPYGTSGSVSETGSTIRTTGISPPGTLTTSAPYVPYVSR